MSTFYRRGHHRNGSWVEGHYVQRDIWDRSSSFHNIGERFQPERKVEQSSFISPNAQCPICYQSVFYYQNHAGSKVWFDSLWPAWDKHPCLYDLEGRTHQSWSNNSIVSEKFTENPAYSCRLLIIKSNLKTIFFKLIEDLDQTIRTSYHSMSADFKDKLNNNYFYTKFGDDIYFFDAENLNADKLKSTQFPTRKLFFAFAKIGRSDFDKLKELKKYHEGVYRLQHHARQHMAAWLYENTKWDFKLVALFSGLTKKEVEKIANQDSVSKSPYFYRVVNPDAFELLDALIAGGVFKCVRSNIVISNF